MKKSLLLFLLCFGIGLAHAVPIEDEPLPFDTRMPPRVAVVPSAAAEQAAPQPRIESRAVCKTVVRKVRGRKVRQQVCSKETRRVTESRSSRHKATGKARHTTKKAVIRKKTAVKSRKRR